jgi:hypothetical protein
LCRARVDASDGTGGAKIDENDTTTVRNDGACSWSNAVEKQRRDWILLMPRILIVAFFRAK